MSGSENLAGGARGRVGQEPRRGTVPGTSGGTVPDDGGGVAPGSGSGATPACEQLAAVLAGEGARVAIVGLGYIGLPLARAFVDAGLDVLGLDVDPAKVTQLDRGQDYLLHLGSGFARRLRDSGRFVASSDPAGLAAVDAVLLCVPTPLNPDREPDLSHVERTARDVAAHLRPGALVVLVSTTWPGTTRQVLLPILEGWAPPDVLHGEGSFGAAEGAWPAGTSAVPPADLASDPPTDPTSDPTAYPTAEQVVTPRRRLGCDLFVAYSPEREDPGRRDLTTATIPRLVGGLDEPSRQLAVQLFERAVRQVVPVASAEVAEAAKLLENIYRAVNVSMVNEMKTVLSALGIDVQQVIDAASTKPFGFAAFRPGPGMGGHCLPIDPFYLAWRARQAGVTARLIEVAGEVDRSMPDWVVGRVAGELARRGKRLSGARVLLLGLAYKADVDDVRESPAFVLIERLEALGATVDYHDPLVPATHPVRHARIEPRRSVPLEAARLQAADVVLVATDHRAIDWELVLEHAALVIDTRGVLRGRGDHVVGA